MPRDTKPPAFMFYPADFASDGVVEAMTTEEVGAYILLLCKAWAEVPPGTIPDDDRVLARWSRLTPERWRKCKPGVLAAWSCIDGRLMQPRLRSEYEKQATRRKEARIRQRMSRARHSDVTRRSLESESETETGLPPPGVGGPGEGGSPAPPLRLCDHSASERHMLRQEHWPLVESVLNAVPDRMNLRPAATETAVLDALLELAGSRGLDGAAQHLVERLTAYAASDRGSSEYVMAVHNWLEQRVYEAPDESWQRGAARKGGAW